MLMYRHALRQEPRNHAHVYIDKLKYIHVQMWRMTSSLLLVGNYTTLFPGTHDHPAFCHLQYRKSQVMENWAGMRLACTDTCTKFTPKIKT